MHLLETYALNCGAKIDKPFIYTTFFPLPIEKYITIHIDEPEPSKNYDYWQDVINIITPVLKQLGIAIIQVGDQNNRHLSEVVDLRGQSNLNQIAHIIKNSMLHLGPDGFALQLAGAFDIPLIGLYGPSPAELTRPYFGSSQRQILLTGYSDLKTKPSYATEEHPKVVNNIKPELIAECVFALLNIDFKIPFETVFIGNKYSTYTIEESIPNYTSLLFNPEHQVEIRADLDMTSESLAFHLANYKKCVLVLEKSIDIGLLATFKQNILSIVFKISNANQVDFLRQIIALGKPIILISSLPQAKIDELKSVFYEFGIINKLETVSEDKLNEFKKDLDALYYRPSKIVASKGKYYYSEAAAEKDIPMANHHEYQKVIDSPSFWENLHCFTIVRVKK